MSLSEKSEEELSSLLAEYGIKHGPIVDSTRKLYERKLQQAMEEAPVQPSSDKTYYREEEEEITYITYHSPVKHEAYTNVLKQRSNAEPEEDGDSDDDTQPPAVQRTPRAANHSVAPSTGAKQPLANRSAGGCLWALLKLLLKLLLLFAVLAAALYFAVCRMAVTQDHTPSAEASDL